MFRKTRAVRVRRPSTDACLCAYRLTDRRGTRAVGVEYSYNPRVRPDEEPGVLRVARARKLVVVSAGALGSPQILERSGIGRKDVLDKVGVEQIVDLPGVGENFQGMASLRWISDAYRGNVNHAHRSSIDLSAVLYIGGL